MSTRNTRRRTSRGRFPAGLTALGVLLAPALGGCGGSDDDPKRGPEQVDVAFVVTGDHRTADVTYEVAGVKTDVKAASLPLRRTVRMSEDRSMSVEVQNPEGNSLGTVTCTVLVGERVISQRTGVEYASCLSVTPTDYTVPGATVPTAGASPRRGKPLPGETRLTTRVPIKRYPGAGSPTRGRVTDGVAHLSYMSLGGDWGASKADPDTSENSREQSFTTEGTWVAMLSSGVLEPDLAAVSKARGPNRLRVLAGAVQDDRQEGNFPDGARGRDVASQPLKVGGRDAWAVVREIRFTKPGIRARLDLSAVVVVDTGRPRPSYVWIDIPETHARLYPDVNTVIDSLRTA
ncbi:hypothetical protein DZF91_33185 [Actinomadura logoneensis]|uniref:Lipoprotein n=1 Tax=Actinomadura logoneensis TaxID=2293572 RepID=A0A372JBI9_9ACTN|nr:hypothetical protein [Actinomadura logoneensis]RFU37375.1 hypothetical protein DZF91_33185 [Actinomadura logoneensis]